MADTGKVVALIKSLGGGADPAAIENAVSDWLDEHITNPDSPPLDRSLTQSNAATPADITGDLKSALMPDATSSDVGKFLKVKTVGSGKVTEYELGAGGGGGGGTDDYSDLDNKPQINGITLNGNKSLDDLGIAACILDVKSGYTHEDVDSVEVQGNSVAFGNVRYADRKNYINSTTTGSSTSGGLTIGKYRNIITIDGVRSSGGNDVTYYEDNNVDIPAGEYVYTILPYVGESVLNTGKKMYLYLWYDGNASGTPDLNISLRSVKDVAVSTTFTATSHIYKIQVLYGYQNNTYSGYKLFFSLFKSDVTIVDTQETVSSSGTLDVEFSSTMSVVDTMMHSSNAAAIIDTKTYIDNKTPNVNFVCFRPEDYGAVGDGDTDDSMALQACIAAAQTGSYSVAKAIRGYGTYKISTGIVFDCRELDVYLNKIIYTGNDAAVRISAQYSNFEFQSIRAFAGGSTAVGIRCYQSSSSLFYHNKIKCGFIRSNGNTVEFKKANDVTVNSMMYNSFYFTYQRSDNANVIEIDSINCNENDFHGKLVQALNGWFLHFTPGSNGGFRFYDYCLENFVQNGTNGPAAFYNCRFAEMQNLQTISDHTKGFVFAWENMAPWGVIERSTGGLNITAINIDNAYSWQDTLDAIKNEYDNGATSPDAPWTNHIMSGAGVTPFFAEINNISCVANANMTSTGGVSMIQEGKVIVYYNNIAFKPYSEVYKKLDADMTILLSDTNDWNYVTPTVFDIDATEVEIYLDASYCCLSINEFDVIQHQGKEAIVYDKFGNVIFNGVGLGAGVYHFKCSMVPYGYHDLYITMEDETVKYCPTGIAKNIYSGENEKWTVTKEEIIEVPANQS